MTPRPDTAARTAGPGGVPWPLLRWFASAATMNVPQAAGPVAFSLLALGVTGDPRGGAAMMLAMILAQVAGAIPITRLGRAWPATVFLRALVAARTAALVAMALLAALGAPFWAIVVCAALAGSVNGALFGYLRAVLNQLTTPDRLPRALGISATLNESTFVLAPVAASLLGTVSPAAAVLAVAVLAAVPGVLIPGVRSGPAAPLPSGGGAVLTPAILLWLACAASGGAVVAAIETGSVALALRFGYAPELAILFTVPLCIASVASGVWVSWRNRHATRPVVAMQLAVMTLGAGIAALGVSAALTVLGAVLIGSVLAPLSTFYSLALDRLAPPHRRPEVFALLRTANAVGVIAAAAMLTTLSPGPALMVVAACIAAVTLAVILAPRTAG